MGKIRVLFVDDQQEVLDGLKRSMYAMRKAWVPSFADSGAAAIEQLLAAPFDVLVTDMNMPGMDGAALLEHALEQYPQTIRVVLTGQYDVDRFVKSGWPAHQFLTKPCETGTLVQTVNHAFNMRELLDNKAIRQGVTKANYLPSLPSIYLQVEKELKSNDASIGRVGEILAKDTGISAKVLQMVNSPIFGGLHRIDSINQAVVRLGADVIQSLVLYLQTCSSIRLPAEYSLARISAHGARIGALARAIARLENQRDDICADAFLAGLLQNVGSLIIISSFPEVYSQIEAESSQQNVSVSEIERRLLGSTHAEIGAYLISLWGLSPRVAEAVAYHDVPSRCPDERMSFVLTAVHVANMLDRDVGLGASFVENDFDFEYLGTYGLLGHLPRWQEKYREMFRGSMA